MTIEMLDALIERLPRLRENGVTHVSVDPKTGAVSVLIAPKLPEAQADAKPVQTYDDGSTYGLPPGTPMPRSFKERQASTRVAPETK